MAVLNPNDQGMDQGQAQQAQPQAPQGQPQPSNSADMVSQSMSQGSSILSDANNLLRQVNELMNNPVVQKRLDQKMDGSQNQPVMSNDPEPEPEPQPSQQPQGQQPKYNVKPEDIETIDLIGAKLQTEDQREELAQAIDVLGMAVNENLDGMETTLEELKNYLTSEGIEEDLKEVGII